MRNFYKKRMHGSSSLVRLVIVDFIRLMLLISIFISVFVERDLVLVISLIGLFFTFLPVTLRTFFNVKFPAGIEVIILMFIFGVFIYIGAMGFFSEFWWWGVLLNFGASVVLGFVGLTVLCVLNDEDVIKASPAIIAFFVFCFALALGVLWEVFEFLLNIGFGFGLQGSLRDTMNDLIVNIFGGVAVSVFGFLYLRSGEKSFSNFFTKNFMLNSFRRLRSKRYLEYSSDMILRLCERGEQDNLEFKSTLRRNLHTNEADKNMGHAVLKTVAGYLNSGPNEAPALSSVIINFTAYSISGAGNLNHSTALINFSSGGETTRENASCEMYESSGDYANYTCNVTMWWFDGTGSWDIIAYVEDNQSNSATNTSTNFYVGERTAFVMSPSGLTWDGITPGATNQTSNNDPLVLNNTGNDDIVATSISINSSNLRGETTSAEALWANNFSVSHATGSSIECAGTAMDRNSYEGIAIANLSKGNYTLNDGSTGQEELYFCLKLAGSELSTQAYSTANETEWNWVVQIL